LDRLRRFTLAYVQLGNAGLAYYAIVNRCTANAATARREGHRLLQDERAHDLVMKLRDKAADKAATSVADWLANELKIARFDIARLFDENGNLLPLSEIDPDSRAAIQSIEVEEEKVEAAVRNGVDVIVRTRVKKIRLHSKDGAQERLGRHLGVFRHDHEQQNPITRLVQALPVDQLRLIDGLLRELNDDQGDTGNASARS
jgi:phage terminase small subunit